MKEKNNFALRQNEKTAADIHLSQQEAIFAGQQKIRQ